MSTAHGAVAGRGTFPRRCPGSFWGWGQHRGTGAAARGVGGQSQSQARLQEASLRGEVHSSPHLFLRLRGRADPADPGGCRATRQGLSSSERWRYPSTGLPELPFLRPFGRSKRGTKRTGPAFSPPQRAEAGSWDVGGSRLLRVAWPGCRDTQTVPAAELSRKPALSAQRSAGSGPVPGRSPPGGSCFPRSTQGRFVRGEAVTSWSRTERAAPRPRRPGLPSRGTRRRAEPEAAQPCAKPRFLPRLQQPQGLRRCFEDQEGDGCRR